MTDERTADQRAPLGTLGTLEAPVANWRHFFDLTMVMMITKEQID
jgi:hypothetical protein